MCLAPVGLSTKGGTQWRKVPHFKFTRRKTIGLELKAKKTLNRLFQIFSTDLEMIAKQKCSDSQVKKNASTSIDMEVKKYLEKMSLLLLRVRSLRFLGLKAFYSLETVGAHP